MYLHFKFHGKRTNDAKVMSKISPVQGQGDTIEIFRRIREVFLAITQFQGCIVQIGE